MAGSTVTPQNQTLPLVNFTDAMPNSTMDTNGTVLADPDLGVNPIVIIAWPIITSLGLVGNTLSFIVMAQLSKSSFYLYLTVLSMSDFALLVLGGIFVWLKDSGLYDPFVNFAHSYCSALYSGTFIFSQFSAWITAAVTVDRYIAVCHPFKVTTYCTRKRASVCMAVLFLILFTVNFPMICYQWNDDYTQCEFPEIAYDYCHKYIKFIDATCYILLPAILICLFNVLIVRGLYKAYKLRLSISNSQQIPGTTAVLKDSTRRTTLMLFSVTSVFVLSLIPLLCVIVVGILTDQMYEDGMESQPTLVTISHVATLVNHSVNFLLYGISGKVFRDKFFELCVCCRVR